MVACGAFAQGALSIYNTNPILDNTGAPPLDRLLGEISKWSWFLV